MTDGSAVTKQELLDALTVERFGRTTPEWHNAPRRQASTDTQIYSLRLVHARARKKAA